MKLPFLRTGAVLALCLPTAGDTVFNGFETTQLPIHQQIDFDVLTDGRYVTMDGQVCDLWAADGTHLLNLATFPSAGETGAMAIHPSETWVLIGERITGLIYRVELDGTGITPLADLDRNAGIAWESNQFAVISAFTGFAGPAFELWRLNIVNSEVEILATLPGAPGPVAIDSAGAVFCATASSTSPPPADSSEIYRFQPEVLTGFDPSGALTFDDDGVLVIQVESVDPAGDWVEETAEAGFTGDSYFRWDGPNFFNTPGQGILSWEFVVDDADTYQLRGYNHHDHPDSTLENDCWARIDNGPWFKCYSGGFVDTWNWAFKFDFDEPEEDTFALWDLDPGVHTLEISGRSTNYRLDRLHLFKEGAPNSQDLAKPHSAPSIPDEADAQLLFENLDGVTSMDVDPELDTLFVSESNQATGISVIHMFGKAFPTTPLMLDASGLAGIGNIRYVHEAGSGSFYPFQESGTGKLYYGRLELGTLDPQRYVMETKRPDLTITGPGTTGTGDFTLEMTDGWNHGFGFILLGSLSTWSPTQTQFFIDGIPILSTGMDVPSMTFINVPLPLTGDGNFSLTLTNATGLSNFLVFQMLVANSGVAVLGSSVEAFL